MAVLVITMIVLAILAIQVAIGILIGGAIATGLGYVIWHLALRALPAALAATVQLSMPVLVALGGTIFLSELLTARLLTASAAMLGGIGLVMSQQVERPAS